MTPIYAKIKEEAQSLLPQMVARRRDLHHYAESGWFEIRTSSLVAQRLTELGYEVLTGRDVCLEGERMGLPSPEKLEQQYQRALSQGAVQPWAERARGGFTGVIGILRRGPGPVVAMRFDMDALGVLEETSDAHRPSMEGFASVNEGMMHACGHDGHTSIGLAVAEILMSIQDSLHGTVKLIFQPAEEGVRGARAVTAHGHLDDVDYLLANHMGDSKGKSPRIGVSTGTTLATSKLDITFLGKAAHAGVTPEQGNNALMAAATAVLNLQAIPRSSQGETRVNVGSLHAGTGRNVICDKAVMEVEVRGANTEVNQYVEDYARRIAAAAAEMHGCTCQIKLMGSAESLSSDQEMIDLCAKVCQEDLELPVCPPTPVAGASEDCAYLMNRVRSHGGKGVYFNTLTCCAGPFHSKTFDFDESSMAYAAALFCGMAVKLLGKGTSE